MLRVTSHEILLAVKRQDFPSTVGGRTAADRRSAAVRVPDRARRDLLLDGLALADATGRIFTSLEPTGDFRAWTPVPIAGARALRRSRVRRCLSAWRSARPMR
jgi:hypothetical protein